MDQLTAIAADFIKLLLDEVIELEQAEFQAALNRVNRCRLVRLYDVAMKIFRDTPNNDATMMSFTGRCQY